MSFIQFTADPPIDLELENITLEATNLSNIQDEDVNLPSSLNATAVSFGEGDVSLKGNMNLLKKNPDLDMEFSLEKAHVTALNEITLQYTGVDFESGTFELFYEIAIADGHLKGYLQPMFINTKLLGEDDDRFFKKLWEGFVGVFKFLFKNQGTDTLATKAPERRFEQHRYRGFQDYPEHIQKCLDRSFYPGYRRRY